MVTDRNVCRPVMFTPPPKLTTWPNTQGLVEPLMAEATQAVLLQEGPLEVHVADESQQPKWEVRC